MRQPTLSDSRFDAYRKKTRRERFLEDMETIIPWKELVRSKAEHSFGILKHQFGFTRDATGGWRKIRIVWWWPVH